jgi:hypothetical protein
MANSLLDFVMSLVRDPDAAARYAADPAAALADANLPDVTGADVDQLIPVVAESLSSAVPAPAGFDSGSWAGSVPAVDSNVWASGAATAAFDAFGIDDAVPVVVDDLDDFAIRDVVTTVPGAPDSVPGILDELNIGDEYADIPVSPVLDDLPVHDTVVDHDWTAPPEATGFDVFD